MITKILLYCLLILLETVICALIFSTEFVNRQVVEEQVAVHDALGRRVADDLRERSDAIFQTAFVETGLVKGTYDVMVPTDQQKADSRGMENMGDGLWNWVSSRLGAFWGQVYQAIYRVTLIMTWLPYTAPIIIPAAVDGLVRREIKKRTAGYASPVRYHAATHSLILLLFAVPFYAMFPLNVSPWFAPAWAAAVACTIALLTANIQKRL